MPVVGTKGAMSSQGFGEFAQASAITNYIEDVFSTYLYTGNGSTQTITNGIDLSTKGGMVITKARSIAYGNILVDTTRGVGNILQTSTTNAQIAESTAVTGVSTTGFSVGSYSNTNGNGQTFASWTFRKQPKFFDVVTWTGNNASSRSVSHSLGSTPGFILIKNLTTAEDWVAWHKDAANGWTGALNSTTAFTRSDNNCNGVTSTTFTTNKNSSPDQYVAYIFAHNAGGFGLTGTDNVISCGSYVGTNGNVSVSLGYEPQWLLLKDSTSPDNWELIDTMRGWPISGTDNNLRPNIANAESSRTLGYLTATGFVAQSAASTLDSTFIYIAIRRGPMKVPTSGTSVFSPVARTGTSATATVTGVGFPPDLFIVKGRSSGTEGATRDRLRGTNPALRTTTTNAESSTTTNGLLSYDMDGVTLGADNTGTDVNGQTNASPSTYANWFFRRAPSFFDEVCYTGTGSNRTVTHNLGVAPEMVIYKRRDTTANWIIYCLYNTAASSNPASNYLNFDASLSSLVTTYYDAPTSSVLNLKSGATNTSGGTYVAYLFATCAGVSKVGSYTGTGTTQQINCGFTSGARFVLIKRTDASLSAWYVWDSARGIVAGNDPYLLLNSTATEVTSTDYIDTYSAGFEISSTAPAAINASGGKFIFLAIA